MWAGSQSTLPASRAVLRERHKQQCKVAGPRRQRSSIGPRLAPRGHQGRDGIQAGELGQLVPLPPKTRCGRPPQDQWLELWVREA